MKKTLTIIFLFAVFTVKAQTKVIDSFLGIKFGTPTAQVLATLKAKGGIVDKENSKSYGYFFDNLSLGHRKASFVIVKFVDDKLYEGDFYFEAELEPKTIEYYNELMSDIEEVYGKGRSFTTFKEPYAAGDGFEVQAITTGNADFSTYWDTEGNPGVINERINSKAQIILSYQDRELGKIAVDKQKTKEKADF